MDTPKANTNWKLWCFWVSVVVVVVVFLIPFERKSFVNADGTGFEFTRTLWDIMTDQKPTTDLYIDGQKWKPRR